MEGYHFAASTELLNDFLYVSYPFKPAQLIWI